MSSVSQAWARLLIFRLIEPGFKLFLFLRLGGAVPCRAGCVKGKKNVLDYPSDSGGCSGLDSRNDLKLYLTSPLELSKCLNV